MDSQTEIYDQVFHLMEIGDCHDKKRPLDAAELLDMASAAIKDLYEKNKRADGMQPFIVHGILVDVHHGLIKVFYDDNE